MQKTKHELCARVRRKNNESAAVKELRRRVRISSCPSTVETLKSATAHAKKIEHLIKQSERRVDKSFAGPLSEVSQI